MTNPPQGRDGTPSVAALAIQVSTLRRDVESLTAKLDALTTTQRDHATALEDITQLKQQIEQILAILSDQDDTSPAAWFWLTMTSQERDAKLAELADWVETVLRKQYPSYLADQIKPCWPSHPEARWELTWLYQLWTLTYLTKRPAPRDAADWHDRWTPGVIRRLSQVMSQCENGCRRQVRPRAIGGQPHRTPA